MAIIEHIEREVAITIEREPIGFIVLAPIREVFSIIETVDLSVKLEVRESALILDDAFDEVIVHPREVAYINDSYIIKTIPKINVRETCRITDTAITSNRLTVIERETVEASSDVVFDVGYLSGDVAYISDKAYTFLQTSLNVRDILEINDRAVISSSIVVRDTASISDGYANRLNSKAIVREVANISDNYNVENALVRASIREVFTIKSKIVIEGQTTQHVERETFYIEDTAIPPALENGVAHTCSTETWGMSKYTNFPFSYITSKFATNKKLWSLTGDTDNGSVIHSHILTGQMDFGSTYRKKIDQVYFNGTSETPMKIEVTADTIRGKQFKYEYTLPSINQSHVRNSRASIGKGFISRYYQFKIRSEDTNYKLLDIEANVAEHTRRI